MFRQSCSIEKFKNCVWHSSEWSALGLEDLPELLEHTVCSLARQDDAIFEEGQAVDGVFLIEKGLVGLERQDSNGMPILMSLAGPGKTLGYLSCVGSGRHMETAVALQPTRGCLIDHRYFGSILRKTPMLAIKFLQTAEENLSDANERYFRRATQSAKGRVAFHLIQLCRRYGQPGESGDFVLNMPCSRVELASLIDVRPESLSRSLASLRDEGALRCSGRSILIKDMDKLAAMARLETASPTSHPIVNGQMAARDMRCEVAQ